ncbi:hypothetical protein JZ751_027162 [Albula glossodonta]|uniref:Uncharacterized protein n=1 Tax=Albula glossodonta TaxID=121402 RepID=A0A8T2NDP0_9TELE|nr:hypothetical protein JZ751_008168 [Albula glossodonta]KAG9338084.1 hypothetical protein JZ751_027162 [Albula glossodonta]
MSPPTIFQCCVFVVSLYEVLSVRPVEQNGLPLSVPPRATPNFVTKDQVAEREGFWGLPQLRVKRMDFLTVVLTGILPHHRDAAAAQPIALGEGVSQPIASGQGVAEPNTAWEGGEEEEKAEFPDSDSSSEPSQDGAPSTLMADEPRGSKGEVSGAEGEGEGEEGSRTLVLFSPGDTRKPPPLEADLGTLAAVTSQCERPPSLLTADQQGGPEPEPLALLPATATTDFGTTAVTTAMASPPFTKVERTFVHIAETSHLNIMSSNGQPVRTDDLNLYKPPCSHTPKEEEVGPHLAAVGGDGLEEGTANNRKLCSMEKEEDVGREGKGERSETSTQSPVEEPQPEPEIQNSLEGNVSTENGTDEAQAVDGLPALCSVDPCPPLAEEEEEETAPEVRFSPAPEGALLSRSPEMGKVLLPPLLRRKSRIPVPVSEEDTGSERSASVRHRLRRRPKPHNLARLVLEKRQERLLHLATSSSTTSSSDEENHRRTSETLSATGSEEEAPDLEESQRGRQERAQRIAGRSRIPIPITPVKRPMAHPAPAAPSPLSLPASSAHSHTPLTVNRPQMQRTGVVAHSTSSQSRLIHSHFPGCSPRMPLRRVFRAAAAAPPPALALPPRSLSACPNTNSAPRTTSPSPPRCLSTKAPLPPVYRRAQTVVLPRPKPTDASTSQPITNPRRRIRPLLQAPPTKGKREAPEVKVAAPEVKVMAR